MSILPSRVSGHGGLAVFISLILVSCRIGGSEQGIVPPPTPPLSRTAVGYGVVVPSYAHVMDMPDPSGISLGFQRRGAVLEVAERRTVGAAEGAVRWVRVAGDGGGWMLESALRVYDNEAQARTAAANLPQ